MNRFGPNLAEMFIGRSSTRFVILVLIWNLIGSDWLKLWKSSSETNQRWNCNIIEMITGWSSTKFVIFVPIAYPRWPPQGNNSLPLDTMGISFKDLFLRNYLTNWIFCYFFADRISKMATTGQLSLPLDPMGISLKNLFVRNYSTNWIFCIILMFLGWSYPDLLFWSRSEIARANNMFWLVETLKIFLSETTQPMEL
jgi:hypothetical protein